MSTRTKPYKSEIQKFDIYDDDNSSIHWSADHDLAVKCAKGSVGETTPGRAGTVGGATILIEMSIDDNPTDCVRMDSDSRFGDLEHAIAILKRVFDELARMED